MPSTLESRLKRLRGTLRPSATETPEENDTPGLAERIRRIAPARVRHCPSGRPNEHSLAEAIGARPVATGVLLLERRVPAGHRHGGRPLACPAAPTHLPLPTGWADDPPDPGHWVCLDTETSGLAGGTGTWAFLTGLLRWDTDGWRLRQYLLCRLDAEPAYLAEIASDLSSPTALVSYNGRAFDTPLLATRYRLAGLPDPLAPLPHLDLLAPVRKAFARGWPDCRLVTAESRLLGLRRRDDLPGRAAPAAWLAWLRNGETRPLAAVLRHNRDDIYSLAGLIPALDRVYRDPSTAGADPRAVAASHSARGDLQLARTILTRHRPTLTSGGLLDLARLHRRLGDWPDAVAIWEDLAATGDPEARAALARYHEHRSGDIRHALALAGQLPESEDRERRLARLLDKLDRQARNPTLSGL